MTQTTRGVTTVAADDGGNAGSGSGRTFTSSRPSMPRLAGLPVPDVSVVRCLGGVFRAGILLLRFFRVAGYESATRIRLPEGSSAYLTTRNTLLCAGGRALRKKWIRAQT